MKRVATEEHEAIVVIPAIVSVVVVVVEPGAIVIPVDVEQVRVAVRIGIRRGYRPCHRASIRQLADSPRCIVSGIFNAIISPTKYLQFFEVSACATLPEIVTADILDAWILDSVASSRNHSQIHLLPNRL